MSTSLPKHYVPTEVEKKWRDRWEQSDCFHADENDQRPPYVITLPPPNVTGSLHMGHALGSTLQDTLIRWRRMQGRNAMWMPGMDHAGIATQMLVERHLRESEGVTRHDLGRDKFLTRVWEWKEDYGGKIAEQMRVMGFSLDWVRDRFTMDEGASHAVREVFVQLYDKGLIYRAHRLVNWCTDCFTAVSDLEVINQDEKGKLWELRYPVVGGGAGDPSHIVVATTRPETMLGDTGVAVHPDDERYANLIGKQVELPLTGRTIPIVADSFVDPEFGSGAVKVTPAHDQNDFDCGQRCGLPALSVINLEGEIIDPAPEKYRGMSVDQARKAVVADLEEAGLLGEVKDYTVPRGRCERSKTVIEPLLSEQWWVKTEPLAEPAIEAVKDGRTQFVPELWTKTYMHWMTNIKDWCISRQLWWGHRIPAWYCGGCGHITVSRTDPTSCEKCGGSELRQDEDVLDTWFSSALWPFSTLGWPENTKALETFYPNAVLVTGPDIIFFWVARMMMMGLEFAGDVPFKKVYLTPIVTDNNGDKMSKVKGNVSNPLDIIRGATIEELLAGAKGNKAAVKFIKKNMPKGVTAAGSDALRFSLAAMTMPGRNIRLSMERIEGYRHFVNKIWNASRFLMINLDGYDPDRFAGLLEGDKLTGEHALSLPDRWIWSRLQTVCDEVDRALEEFRFAEAANHLYHFVWHEFCDWYIELAKSHLTEDAAPGRRLVTQGTLANVLERCLRLLSPMMPFVTEEIWERLPRPGNQPEFVMVTVYPTREERFVDEAAEADMGLLMEVAGAVRSIRSTYNVKPSARVDVQIRVADAAKRELLGAHASVIEHSARVNVALSESGDHVPQSGKRFVGSDIEVVIPLAGLVDIEAEKKRIEKEIGKADKEIVFFDKKLANKNFTDRAPAEVVQETAGRRDEEKARRERLAEALEALG